MLPNPPSLAIHVQGPLIRLTGDLDMETANALAAAGERLVTEDHRHITIDCAGVTFCDSYGLRALERVANLVSPDGSATIAQPSPTLNRILDISGIAGSFTILGDELGSGVGAS